MKNYKITVNGNVYDVTVEEGVAQTTSTPMAASIITPVAAPVMQVAAPVAPVLQTASSNAPVKPVAASGTQGTTKVNSPMPGKILNVNVSVGQSVKRGEVLVVLEAMKMENEIVAPKDGTVASVHVSVGVSVESGDILATLN